MTTDPTVERRPLSSSVGAYLEAIWAAAETGCAPTKEVATRLSVSPASVTTKKRTFPLLGKVRGAPGGVLGAPG
jgi:iron dependent repressor-like protein